MSRIESKLIEENENNKELFNFNGNEAQLKHLKELFTNYIRDSNNDSRYFIDFLDHYSTCRKNNHHVTKELVECVYSSF